MDTILHRIGEAFDPDAIVNAVAAWLPNLVVAAITLLVFWGLHRLTGRTVRFVMKRAHVDETAVSFVQTMVRYALFTIAAVTVLGQLGVDVSGILASLGVVGLTVGFAARDALSNIISGVFIFWDRPFVIGDLVEIGDNYGEVVAITMRSTRVVTPDGKMLAIPNSTIVNTVVASYTNFPNLRIDVDVSVGVAEDLHRVRGLLLGLVQGDPAYMEERPAVVAVTKLGDFNNTVELRAWLKDEKQHVRARFELRERVYAALTAAGVDMPFETLSINPVQVRSVSEPPR
jgi:small conductance mechanosensitive channel